MLSAQKEWRRMQFFTCEQHNWSSRIQQASPWLLLGSLKIKPSENFACDVAEGDYWELVYPDFHILIELFVFLPARASTQPWEIQSQQKQAKCCYSGVTQVSQAFYHLFNERIAYESVIRQRPCLSWDTLSSFQEGVAINRKALSHLRQPKIFQSTPLVQLISVHASVEALAAHTMSTRWTTRCLNNQSRLCVQLMNHALNVHLLSTRNGKRSSGCNLHDE